MKTFLAHFMKEIKPFITLILAFALFVLISGFGILWNIGKPIFHIHKGGFRKIAKNWVFYWFKILYQVWVVIKYLINRISFVIDILGNVLAGELLEDTVTVNEKTWFGDGKISVSAAIGNEEHRKSLVPFGEKVTKILGKVFEKNHSMNAYDKKVLLDKFNADRGVKFDV